MSGLLTDLVPRCRPEAAGASIGAASTRDSRVRRFALGGGQRIARAGDGTHLLKQFGPRVRIRHKARKHLDRALGLELENEELVPHQGFELGERQVHEPLARDVQRESTALIEAPIGGDDVQHRPGQRLVEPSGLQHRGVRIRSGLTGRQHFGRCFEHRPRDAVPSDAEQRLDNRRAVEAEEHLLLQLVTRRLPGSRAVVICVETNVCSPRNGLSAATGLRAAETAVSQRLHTLIQGLLSAKIV